MTEDQFLDVAAAILDGTPVSWETLPQPETASDRGFLRQLRLIADVAAANRLVGAHGRSRWGPLVIIEHVGSGTFGDVYRARDTALDRDVALKLLRRTAQAGAADEGRLLARVRHPHVVTVYGAAEHDGQYGIWMEFIQGRTLAELVAERGPFTPAEVGAIGADICRALGAVHASGLFHGDIKAQNVMRADGGLGAEAASAGSAKAARIVLMDFGTGRLAGHESRDVVLAGTPLYVAPEVLAGQPVDIRADIYSVGVLLYYLLTGSYPITGATLADVRNAHAAGRRIPVRERRAEACPERAHPGFRRASRRVPRRLAAVIDRATSPQPADRFETAGSLEHSLAKTSNARSRSVVAAFVLVAAGVAAIGLLAGSQVRPSLVDPADLRLQLTEDAVIAHDGAGRVQWRHAFSASHRRPPPGFRPVLWEIMTGSNPAAYFGTAYRVRHSDGVAESGELFETALDGRLRRTFSFNDEVAFGPVKYGAPWVIASFDVDASTTARRTAVAAHHYVWDPSLVTVLDDVWQRRGTFVHAGWIEYVQWLAPDRLLIGGFSQAQDGGMISVLDPAALDGQGPEPPGTRYHCETCGTAVPLRMVVMPRSEVNRGTNSPFNRAVVQLISDRIVVYTIEVPAVARPADAVYEFSHTLDLIGASYSERYWEVHRALETEGKIAHARDQCPDRDGPRQIKLWEPTAGWKTIRTRTR